MTSGLESVERLETKVIYPVDFLGRRREGGLIPHGYRTGCG